MGYEDFVSEGEAASVAGISVATLNRFVEAGYLQTESDSDGIRLFSKSEIFNLFGIKDASPYYAEALDGSPLDSSLSEDTPTEPPSPASLYKPEQAAKVVETPVPPLEDAPPAKTEKVIEVRLQSEKSEPAPRPAQIPESDGPPTQNSSVIFKLQQEIAKFKNIVDLQERILSMKDEEAKRFKSEIDWLRSRVERLEEKAERDQLLLLAEAQTIRGLVTAQSQKKSTIRLALEWFGFLPPPPEQDERTGLRRSTIDISRPNAQTPLKEEKESSHN